MSDQNSIAPEWISAACEFQNLFGHYFPHLKDDLDLAAFEMDWLHNSVFGNPLPTVRRTKAKRELNQILSFLKRISQHEMSYWLTLNIDLYWSQQRKDKYAKHLRDISSFLLLLNELREEGILSEVIEQFGVAAVQAINQTVDAKNVNWEAVHAIERLRWLWWRNTGRDGPTRALNPASTYSSYLREAFEYLEIQGDHLSAFKRWASVREGIFPDDSAPGRKHPYPYLTE